MGIFEKQIKYSVRIEYVIKQKSHGLLLDMIYYRSRCVFSIPEFWR